MEIKIRWPKVGRQIEEQIEEIDPTVYPVEIIGGAQVYLPTGKVESWFGRDRTRLVLSDVNSYFTRDWSNHFTELVGKTVTLESLLSSFDPEGRFAPLRGYLVRPHGVVRRDEETSRERMALELTLGLYERVSYRITELHFLTRIFGIPFMDSGEKLTRFLSAQKINALFFQPTSSLGMRSKVSRPSSQL